MKIVKRLFVIPMLLLSGMAWAEADYQFNPQFLGGGQAMSADLSWVNDGGELPPGQYDVNIYVNTVYVTSHSVSFQMVERGLSPCLTPDVLEKLGIDLHRLVSQATATQRCYSPDMDASDIRVSLDVATMNLQFTVPQGMMINRPRGYISPSSWEYGIHAGFLSYMINGSYREQINGERVRSRPLFAGLNSGLNLGAWRLRDYSTWNRSEGGAKFNRVRTWLQRDLAALRGQLYLGESYTSASLFDAVGVRGVQLNSDDNMLPASQRGYAPVIRGIARSQATVTLSQSGNVIYQTTVPPGEFTIGDLYPTASGGDIEVTQEEEGGSVRRWVVPFASVPNLVREGQAKYAVSLGRYRPQYQQTDPLFVQGELFYGMSHGLTLYSGTQLADNYQALAFGVGQNMGRFGALSLDLTHAHSRLADRQRYDGDSIRLRYSKVLSSTGTRLNFYSWRFSTQGFYNLSDTTRKRMNGGSQVESVDENGTTVTEYHDFYNLRYARKDRHQVLLAQTLSDWGSVSLSWERQGYWNSDRASESLQLSWSSSIGKVSWGAAWQQTRTLWSNQKDNIFSLNASIPLGEVRNATRVSYGVTSSETRDTSHRVGVSGYLPGMDNLNYSFSQRYARDNGYGADLSMQYLGSKGNVSLGYSYTDNSRTLSYGLSGGAVLHEDGVTLGQALGNTNILVKAPGAYGVAVEGRRGVRTDSRGYAVVPWATPYRLNRVALDIRDMPDTAELDSSVVSRIPVDGAMSRADFAIRSGFKAMFSLSYRDNVLPFGTLITQEGSESGSGIVGDNGAVYLSGLAPTGTLIARWDKGESHQCRIDYHLDDTRLNARTGLYIQEGVCR
ncbi:fimbrial biogenesis outer membrane usher protein [Jejubacter calystegiae]|uniref:Fimbrial biogenesis outer membrane usher protein n=2 Tax=Jejubacter calystegiae TaxID=2579935 RepID=A0A4P8YGS6_9ENTR|nr:fimbria/pilus outer membrane usher protein [Jejubacter calystegiae]QCT19760.1 fimbrial biogenesis outer membrane usher protein [Jejubacter calystegiae]